jgi:hypothetical protein
MAHGHDDNDHDLPKSWPFTFAGLCLTVALVWFCLGFAIKDRKLPEGFEQEGPTELAGHFPVFWGLLALGALSVIVGIVMNMVRENRRNRH